jgi:methylthioxylose transferase
MESVASTSRPAIVRASLDVPAIAIGALAIALWAALIAGGWAWGSALNDSGAVIGLGAPPLHGDWILDLDWAVLLPVGVALAVVAAAPLARTISWRALIAGSALGSVVWAVALALTAGSDGLVGPLVNSNEYLASVPLAGSPGEFLDTFTERIGDYTTHVRSHPPGLVLALLGLEEIGLGGPWPLAIGTLAIAGSAVPAGLVAMRAVAGEAAARRAAPYLILVPGAVWIATSADALLMGVGAWAVALGVFAITSSGRRSDVLGVASGLAFAAAALLSYGAILLGAIPLAVAVVRRRARPFALAGLGFAAVMLALLAAGFWWVDGFFAIREQYLGSVQQTRPYDFFLLNNLGAFALAAGPALALGLALLRDRATWLLVGGAAAAVVAADLSGMSKGEVERIWLPFLPWILLATSALPDRRVPLRGLLASQAALGIAIEVGVRTPW